MLFHNEEKTTTALLEAYQRSNPGAILVMAFEDGGTYRCRFFTSFEDEGDEEAASSYDEYYTLVYEVVETLNDPHIACEAVNDGFLSINYKYFPLRVIDESGNVVYRR